MESVNKICLTVSENNVNCFLMNDKNLFMEISEVHLQNYFDKSYR